MIAFGILNLIFALVCGCIHGSGVGFLSQIGETDVNIFEDPQFDQSIDEAFDEEIAKTDDADEKRALESLRDYIKSDEFKQTVSEAVTYMAESENGQRLKQVMTAGAIAQILMLLSGALLLARVKVALRAVSALRQSSVLFRTVRRLLPPVETKSD